MSAQSKGIFATHTSSPVVTFMLRESDDMNIIKIYTNSPFDSPLLAIIIVFSHLGTIYSVHVNTKYVQQRSIFQFSLRGTAICRLSESQITMVRYADS